MKENRPNKANHVKRNCHCLCRGAHIEWVKLNGGGSYVGLLCTEAYHSQKK